MAAHNNHIDPTDSTDGNVCVLIHDLRNYLTVILGQCELALDDRDQTSRDERLNVIRSAVEVISEKLARHTCRLAAAYTPSVRSDSGQDNDELPN